MEELEHTCPHPRTVGRLIECVRVFACVFMSCGACNRAREEDKGSGFLSPVMKPIPHSMWLWDILRTLSGKCVCLNEGGVSCSGQHSMDVLLKGHCGSKVGEPPVCSLLLFSSLV